MSESWTNREHPATFKQHAVHKADNVVHNVPESRVQEWFLKQCKRGILPSRNQLRDYCRKRSIRCTDGQLRSLRYRFKLLAMLSKFKKPLHYMGASFLRPGNLMIDMAHHSKFPVHNGKAKYFLVGVELVSGKLTCVPSVKKDSRAWEKGIISMIKSYGHVGTIISDRDGVAVSTRFKKKLWDRYRIKWSYLKSRSKAFRSERMIGYLRRRISMSLRLDKGNYNWTKKLPAILDSYNSETLPGTSFTRNDIDKSNYIKMWNEKNDSNDASMLFNIANGNNFTPWLRKRIFKFPLGSKVLLAREADYTAGTTQNEGKKAKSVFLKRSSEGSYTSRTHVVVGHVLKSNAKHFLSAAYRLKSLSSLYYESELIPLLQNDVTDMD